MSKKTEIMNSASRALHKVGFKLKKHSPELLVVGGVIGGVTSAVMACKATLKVNDIVVETKEQLDKIHDASEKLEAGEVLKCGDGTEYTVENVKKDTVIVYAQTGVKLLKLYGPALALGTVSIAAILGGHKILSKRNAALAAAYTAIDKGFKEYRGRVVERFGEELDKELRYGVKNKEVEEIVTNEDGSESVVKKTIQVVEDDAPSIYARFFDDGCTGWEKDPELNLMFLTAQQAYANNKLQTKGYLFLNEVYDMLGIPRTKAGQIVGWVYDKDNVDGDNYIDFGIYNVANKKSREFVNGFERTILLDFNVDGNILDKM